MPRKNIITPCILVLYLAVCSSEIVSNNHHSWKLPNNVTRLRHSRHLLDKSGSIHSSYMNESHSTLEYGSAKRISQENHKPVFKDCESYYPSVNEEEDIGTPVFQVHAVDNDPIDNGGKVTYTFVSAPGEKLKFKIDPNTGNITTNYVFDRDEVRREKEVYLTVRATDNGRPQLDDVCTIKVVIKDINDNYPVFDKVNYKESVPKDEKEGRKVMQISATDIDDGNNSIVEYALESKVPSEIGYFKIGKSTGVIILGKTIDKDVGHTFQLTAYAKDQGAPLPGKEVLLQFIPLEIVVVESNKKAPVFLEIPSSPIILKENLTDYTYNIATLRAESSTDEVAPVFELVTGRTENTNKLSTFRLESEGQEAHVRLARHMDYESIPEYTLTIRIQNKYNLAAETSFHINLEDVNDNIPVFTELLSGIVFENEPPGTPVMQVRAIDADSTTAHNQVHYELADNKDNFSIDKYAGSISTKKEFDREEQDFYNVKVIATDNSPSALYSTGIHNKGEQVFRIEIADKNDHPPIFNQHVYVADSIPEDSNINALVTEVIAIDNDTASPVSYSIKEGNIGERFSIEEKTGKIRVKNPLDYENRTSYILKVRAFDGVYEDECTVEIRIENVNDNPPVFLPFKPNIKDIIEEQEYPGCIAKLEAYDPDISDRNLNQHIDYSVVKKEQKELLQINKEGCLSLIKPLDRDPPGSDKWQVLIVASDEDGNPSGLQTSTDVFITLTDINDNAPELDMNQPVVWKENQPPRTIITLQAKDIDGPGNGPPFTYSLGNSSSADILGKFSINGKELKALVTFDREEKKNYFIPITIIDSGIPAQTGSSTLHVVIGDENDNAMKEGSSSIFIYSYKGQAPDTQIGRVYVNDPDDWDLEDKEFYWEGEKHRHFDLLSDTGMITMLQGTPAQSYLLKFNVSEGGRIPKHSVSATVNITVKEIPEEAVDRSGSIRFTGITAEEFVETDSAGISRHSLLCNRLAKYFNISEENVDVFTVLHSPRNTNPTHLDVRFSAHSSPYYPAEKINAVVSANKKELEDELKATILMISIDECLIEKLYCNNSCSNFLNKSNVTMPVYTNTTSFVGVKAVVDPLCTCYLTQPTICHNGGTRVGDICECPEGFDGPHCERVAIGFSGNGWALYPTLQACGDSHVSLKLRSNKQYGLVFYVGPTTPNLALPIQDFMSLELQNGYPVLLVDFGSGTVRVEQKQILISDGGEHQIDIILSKTSIELQVDNCKLPSCFNLTLPQGPNEFLNVNGPLQVGGSFIDLQYLSKYMNWSQVPTKEGFHGCISQFTFNGKMYNFGMPSLSENADLGCNNGVAVAISFSIDPSFLIALLVCIAILLILLLAVVVHRRRTDDLYKDTDDIRENIINYEDEGGGEGDMTGYDLNVLRLTYDDPLQQKQQDYLLQRSGPDEVPDICGFLDGKKQTVDNDPETNPFDDVRHYAYEGDGNTTGSLSSLASGTDEGDLNFDYLSNFGPRFRKLADMYGEDPSDEEEDNYQHTASESWC